jgi:site-specific DNA-methyltransferase (adenine-specific)/modification methylase
MTKLLNKIVNGDSLKILKTIPNKTFDLVFADPPYNLQIGKKLKRPDDSKVNGVNDKWDQFESFNDYDNFCKKWLKECKRVLKDNGSIWVIGTYHNIFRLGYHMQNIGFWILNDVIWKKNNPMPNFRGTRFTNAHETLIWASKNKKSKYTFNYQSLKCLNDDLQMRSDWTLPICNGSERVKKNGKKVHSAQKPESLLLRILLASTNKNDFVFDPFLGTGTTAVVAKKLGRNYFGIEREKKYFNTAKQRLEKTIKIEDHYLDTIKNNKSKPRIPFGSLVELGIVKPGMSIFDHKKKVNAKIMADGSIKYKNSEGSIHKMAAKIIGTESCNGWTFWHYNNNGSILPIDNLRQRLITNN